MEIFLPSPHAGQIAVRSQAKRFNMLICGRRWRKTTLAMAISVEAALEGKNIIWGAPVYDQVRVCWEETILAVGDQIDMNQSRMEAKFPGGGSILYRSLDNPNNVRGHTAHGVVIDEVADVVPAAWGEVLRPMLIDTVGWAWLIGTPKGSGWVRDIYNQWKNGKNSMSWQVPTLGCKITEEDELIRVPHPLENPNIDFEEIQSYYQTVARLKFEQEILALFVSDGGAVFRLVDEVSILYMESPVLRHEYVAGVDWGQVNDWTVVSVIDITTNKQVFVQRFQRIGWAYQRRKVLDVIYRYRPALTLVEKNSIGGPNLEELEDHLASEEDLGIEGFQMSQTSKEEVIEALSLSIQRGAGGFEDGLLLLDDEEQKRELIAYQKARLPGGRFTYSAPAGMHDDTVVALAVANKARMQFLNMTSMMQGSFEWSPQS